MRGFLARWTVLVLLAAAVGAAGSLAVVTSVRAHRAGPVRADPTGTITPDHSTNWVGYVFLAENVTGVRAEWVEPDVQAAQFSGRTAQPTTAEAASVWLGIGGDLSADIMQAGTLAYMGGPYGIDEAWYERWPLDPHQMNSGFEVFGGDVIAGSIALVPGSASDWRVTITETGTGAAWSRVVHYKALLEGPEFVVEDPGRSRSGGLMNLPRWGSVSFLHMQIRVGRHWRPASAFSALRIEMIRSGKVVATAGPLLASSAFTAYQR